MAVKTPHAQRLDNGAARGIATRVPHADSLTTFRLRVLGALIVSAGASAPVQAAAPPFETRAPVAYMIDLSSGAVLYAKDADKRILPASMTKMMTVYTAFKLLGARKYKLTDQYMMRPEMWAKWAHADESSIMFIGAGEKVSAENLLHGITTVSGNDASEMFAAGVMGSEAAFVALMNKDAAQLGLRNSHFGTVTGWPDEGRTYASARDLAVLGQATLYDFPQLYHAFYGKPDFTWGRNMKTGKGIEQPNRNPILGRIAGADGIKTGHTAEAGFCFAGSAEQNGRRLIMVVAGLGSEGERIAESVKFMDWGFKAWASAPLVAAGKLIGKAPVQLGSSATVGLIAPRNVGVTRALGDKSAAKISYAFNGPVKAPITKGQHVADLVVEVPGMAPQVTPLVAAEDVGLGTFLGRAWAGFMSFFS
jgi:serine-type D-Ala-D-Ala carboxypeptidase (penicillin-binding protein 5/6)